MPDDARLPERELTVAEAFARLPLETPERSAWPVLAARLAATEDRPRGPRSPCPGGVSPRSACDCGRPHRRPRPRPQARRARPRAITSHPRAPRVTTQQSSQASAPSRGIA